MRRSLLFLGCLVIVTMIISPVNSLGNQCGIKYCTSCDSKTNFCNECDLPYKPGYANQTVCTRCANNCQVCQKEGTDSKGRCLSCLPNFNFQSDNYCDTFYIWIYIVVIASYAVFILTLFVVFCLMKRRKERKQGQWFQNLKTQYNLVDTDAVTMINFEKLCEQLIELLKESSSYNSLKFKDNEYEKAIKIKQITLKPVPKQTHIKKIKIIGSDNSQFQAKGFVYVPRNSSSQIKLWFAKNYKRKVFSESISKIIIYETDKVDQNDVKGRWYYYGAQEVCGTWRGLRHHVYLETVNNVEAPERPALN